MKILIIGLGSIARKHIYVLRELVPEVQLFALRSTAKSSKEIGVTNLYSWEGLSTYSFDFAIVSSPSALHLSHIKTLSEIGIPLMVEKPLFVNLDQLKAYENLQSKPPLLYVACNFRFHPLIEFLKLYLEENPSKINEVISYCGSYLPNWRPGQDYRLVYSSRKELGGGVHLDLVHEPDYITYLFGMPKSATSSHRKVSNLEIDTYDSSNYLFQYEEFQAQISLNYFRKDTKRTLEIIREKDTLFIDFISGKISDLSEGGAVLFENKNDAIYTTYEKQMRYFMACVQKKEIPMNNAEEAIQILKCIL